MKKIMAVLTVLMCFASTSVFAQEVRGIETRRVIYEGEKRYDYGVHGSRSSYEYFGFEFKNMNSISVSVDIELYDGTNQLKKTKSVVLGPGETYLLKADLEAHYYDYDGSPSRDVDAYYVKYKAFKLQ